MPSYFLPTIETVGAGMRVRGIGNWDRFPLELLSEVVDCVGGDALAAICQCFAEDHSSWHSGMPDLLLWRPATRSAQLVEVRSVSRFPR